MTRNMDILDGGMGHMIKRLGVSIEGSQPGSIERFHNLTMANVLDPDIVQKAHVEFLNSGCNVITTNNYAAIPKCLRFDHLINAQNIKKNIDVQGHTYSKTSIAQVLRETGFFDRSGHNNNKQKMALKLWEDVIIASGENAAKAKKRHLDSRERQNLSNIKIAGAIPPLAESYRHDLVGPYEENVMQYEIIIKTLLDYVDLFICETMSTIEESKAAVEAAIKVMKEAHKQKPIWVSWTLDDITGEKEPVLRSGESIRNAIKSIENRIKPNGPVEGLLFNCSSPEIITNGLRIMDKEISYFELSAKSGAYANGFLQIFDENKNLSHESKTKKDEVSISEYRQDLTPSEYYERYVKEWTKNDTVRIVGGCCGIFPEHIKYLSNEIDKEE